MILFNEIMSLWWLWLIFVLFGIAGASITLLVALMFSSRRWLWFEILWYSFLIIMVTGFFGFFAAGIEFLYNLIIWRNHGPL